MKRLLVVVVLFLSVSTCIEAQYVRPPNASEPNQAAPPPTTYSFSDHASIGGNFSLLFGDITYIVVAPLLNYHLNKNFVIGAGPLYQYYSIQESPISFTSSIYGGRVVGMCFLPDRLSNIFIQAEYDFLNVPDFYTYSNNTRTTVGIPLVGAGYRQPAGEKSYLTLSVLFDLSGSPLSPYYSGSSSPFPIVFAGIDIGL